MMRAAICSRSLVNTVPTLCDKLSTDYSYIVRQTTGTITPEGMSVILIKIIQIYPELLANSFCTPSNKELQSVMTAGYGSSFLI